MTFRDDKNPSDYNEEVKKNEAKDKGERKNVGGGAISRKRDQQKRFLSDTRSKLSTVTTKKKENIVANAVAVLFAKH